jgi:hypothetical protein
MTVEQTQTPIAPNGANLSLNAPSSETRGLLITTGAALLSIEFAPSTFGAAHNTPQEEFSDMAESVLAIYDEAGQKAMIARYRLTMPEVFSPERLEREREVLADAEATMNRLSFWHQAFWVGATSDAWETQRDELASLWRARIETGRPCFAARLWDVQRLLDALVEVEA